MNAKYVTLSNGLTFLVKPNYTMGKLMYCYYWFNNFWFPTILNTDMISNTRSVKLDDSTMSLYNDSVDEELTLQTTNGFTTIPDTYRSYRAGSSELFTNNPTGIKPMLVQSTGGKATYGTVVAPIFPKVESDWFYTGFPTKLTVGGSTGNLVEYIPIYFYATKNGNEKFTLPKLPDRVGYFDLNNVFTETLVWDGPFKKGDLMFTLLLDKNSPECKDSKLADASYWSLLTEFSNIDPGSGSSKSITISTGITKDQSYSLSLSVGSRIAVEAGLEGIAKISAELSAQISTSFNTDVSITRQITTTDTVEFKPQPKTQRISTYQFMEQYKIDAAEPLKNKVDSFNDKDKNYVANFARADFEPRPFDYESRYFAKAFVLDPGM